jgi:S1-C subfamily serine protease
MSKKMFCRACFLYILAIPFIALSHWDDVRFKNLPSGKTYEINSGTGFFVNRENIVTNRHVVEKCLNIAIRGAVPDQLATLIAVDQELDLALLKSQSAPQRIPYLRINYDKVSVNDTIFTIGYPLEHSNTGQYLIKESVVIKVSERTDNTNFTNIQFTDIINHGNSGGPLLDKNSNIIGVVTAKLTFYSKEDPNVATKTLGMAIGLDGLIEFLKKNRIFYASNSTYDIFTNYNVDRLVKDYVVNIHCIKQNQNEGN